MQGSMGIIRNMTYCGLRPVDAEGPAAVAGVGGPPPSGDWLLTLFAAGGGGAGVAAAPGALDGDCCDDHRVIVLALLGPTSCAGAPGLAAPTLVLQHSKGGQKTLTSSMVPCVQTTGGS